METKKQKKTDNSYSGYSDTGGYCGCGNNSFITGA